MASLLLEGSAIPVWTSTRGLALGDGWEDTVGKRRRFRGRLTALSRMYSLVANRPQPCGTSNKESPNPLAYL